MKRIVNRRKYDTDTATCIVDWDNGLLQTDFNYHCFGVYKKKNGEFFRADWYYFRGQNKITPITEDEAKDYAEKYLDADEYEKCFGFVEE